MLKKARGHECLDKVCKSLGLLEREYFGLCYQDKSGDRLWVNLRNPLSEQIPHGNHIIMEMRVKYFISPHKILQPVTRYQFYQQTKRDLLQGKLLVDTAIRAARIAGLMAQVDHGDYKPNLVYRHTITVQSTADNLEARTKREHQKLAGLSTEIAIEKFLSEVAGLPLYGVELYGISGGQYLGVGPEYITTYTADKTTVKQYSYSSVKYTAFQGKRFKVLIKDPRDGASEDLEVELSSRAAAQALYRAVTEFHTFFRRDAVSDVVKTAGYCKSRLGNIKSQIPDRFYFDVTRTHKEIVNHVWSLLNSSDQTGGRQSVPPSPRLRRGRSQHDPLPPIPGAASSTPSGSRLQRAASMQHPLRPNVCYQQMPPLPTFTQASHSADVVVINNRPHLAPHMTSLASMPPFIRQQTISESSDDTSSTYSSEYTTMSSRLGPAYSQHTGMPNSSSQDLSESYVTSRASVASGTSRGRSTVNSPPPGYSEVDPDQQSTPLAFTDTPHSAGLPLVSPAASLPISGEGIFSFDATCVLTRTRELEGELQRLRSAMTCRLCKQNPIGATFCPCGHTVCCFSCAQRLRTCWECDVLVHSVQRMLLASAV